MSGEPRKLPREARRLNSVRNLLALGLAAFFLITACSEDQATIDEAPELSQEGQADLTVMAIDTACSDLCVGQPIYFRDQLLDVDTLVGEEESMPETTRTAIEDAYPEVVWVDFDGADEILEQVDNAEAVLLSVSAFSELAPGVQGVDVGIMHGAFHGQTIQFQWNGTEWIEAESEDTGVTVTSVVS